MSGPLASSPSTSAPSIPSALGHVVGDDASTADTDLLRPTDTGRCVDGRRGKSYRGRLALVNAPHLSHGSAAAESTSAPFSGRPSVCPDQRSGCEPEPSPRGVVRA